MTTKKQECTSACVHVHTYVVTFRSLQRHRGGSKVKVGDAPDFGSSRRWSLQKKKKSELCMGTPELWPTLKTFLGTPLRNQGSYKGTEKANGEPNVSTEINPDEEDTHEEHYNPPLQLCQSGKEHLGSGEGAQLHTSRTHILVKEAVAWRTQVLSHRTQFIYFGL